MIEFKNFSIKYVNDFYSIFNLNLKIEKNILLLGDRLDGGFALMRALLKIDKTYTGEIIINNKNIKQIKDKNLDLSYVSYTPTLFKFKTAKQNIIYPLTLRKFDKKSCDNLAQNLLEKYHINFGEIKAKNLTISEAKITTLLRAIVRKPKIILLEHFFENLDEKYLVLANKIIEDIAPEILTIATEQTKQISFENFEMHTIKNGSLIDW